ncbi:MAG: isocitrate lyase/phosphoenolpyruvate mutase family protein [Actinobacteria bacterium]|uniref:2-methylisocitrate lyase-like PEP mutase family enzyme n=1 Tax=Nocardioides marinus TaxID=374514 RepID=A0A7Y9YE13_9ACTN|nr:isocitrate lyase/phosphoenolpyruvate mutase family protein [Actinomycetota bacterium]MBU2111845.1 isocitrate lyase/phosphoenolpyruvate mutase family protein [Actinomycetota bacterium]NYI10506.1 2-methylisocitrate lyase-like PEP mutase family enzyme [Nocardioides marinus]
MTTTPDRASALLDLHRDPALLTVVNVWDAISARVVADVPGTRALATASHSIASMYGYEDGEHIPVDLMLEAVGRIVAATDLPVTADLEGGYGDPAETVRRAIGLGVVGCNLEDQLRPLDEAVSRVEAVLAAAEAEGVPDFVLNARTDVFLRAGDRDPAEVLDDAVRRCRAFLDAGAPVVFVPGFLDAEQVRTLVEATGPQRLTLIALPGHPSLATLEELGVARVSFGPISQNVALTALQELVEEVHRGGTAPATTRRLN